MAGILKKTGRPPKRASASLATSLAKAGVSDVAYEIASIGIMAKEQGDLSLALKAFTELMGYQYAKKKAIDHKIDASAKMPNVQIIVSGDVSMNSDGSEIKTGRAISQDKKQSEPLEGAFVDLEEKEKV